MDRSFDAAVATLGSLISSDEAQEQWALDRRNNKKIDVRQEMLNYLKGLDLDVGRLSCLHVAGTKGKGSTCAFAESILRRGYGLRTGLFTSPHLIDVCERIRIDGRPLAREIFAKYFWDTSDRLQAANFRLPTYFRFLTLVAFNVFLNEKVDVAVIEVGLGGRTDATNVVHPVVCGISSLGLDHQHVLGDTLAEIAYEKAGIFKTGVPACTVPQKQEAMKSLMEQAAIRQVSLEVVPAMDAWSPGPCQLGILGEFQKENASLAVALCREWLRKKMNQLSTTTPNQNDISPHLTGFLANTSGPSPLPPGFLRGLEECRWPGRAQLVPLSATTATSGSEGAVSTQSAQRENQEILLYLDGAHTEESMEVCAQWFRNTLPSDPDVGGHERRVLVFGCTENRSAAKLLTRLFTAMTEGSAHQKREESVSPFDVAIFTSFALKNSPSGGGGGCGASTTSAITVDAADPKRHDLRWQRTQAEIWTNLVKQQYADSPPASLSSCEARVVDSILTALDSVAQLHQQWRNDEQRWKGKTRVLVTGSLYLVGGVLKVLLARGIISPSVADL